MARITFFCCSKAIILTLVVAVQLTALHAQGTVAPPSLQEQLEAQYPLGKITTQGGCTVTNPDTALALQQAGIGALPSKSFSTMCAAHYRNGSITKTGFKCNYYLNMIKQSLVTLEKGDKVFPLKLEVDKDEVKLAFAYCSGDNGQAVAYTGQVVIEFPKDSLKNANVPQVEDKINEVFSADAGGQQQAQAGPGPAQPQDNQAQPQSNQNQSSACNIEIGQTVVQVEAACGKPASQAKGAATKLLYFYNQPKLKITFIDGKVTDID